MIVRDRLDALRRIGIIGRASFSASGVTQAEVFRAADYDMYVAKREHVLDRARTPAIT